MLTLDQCTVIRSSVQLTTCDVRGVGPCSGGVRHRGGVAGQPPLQHSVDESDRVHAVAAEQPHGLVGERAVAAADPQEQRRYAALLGDTVADGGYALLAGFAPDGPTHCSGLPLARRSADEVAALAGEAFDTVRIGHDLHTTPAGADQPFTWVLLRRLPGTGPDAASGSIGAGTVSGAHFAGGTDGG